VRIHAALSEVNVASRLILQVHDEVLVEVPESERETVGPIVIGIMRNAAKLDVPLEVNVSWGASWASAKG
jgi:DNA polymerase I